MRTPIILVAFFLILAVVFVSSRDSTDRLNSPETEHQLRGQPLQSIPDSTGIQVDHEDVGRRVNESGHQKADKYIQQSATSNGASAQVSTTIRDRGISQVVPYSNPLQAETAGGAVAPGVVATTTELIRDSQNAAGSGTGESAPPVVNSGPEEIASQTLGPNPNQGDSRLLVPIPGENDPQAFGPGPGENEPQLINGPGPGENEPQVINGPGPGENEPQPIGPGPGE